jgi:Zn-dependent M28 family amino/carboxypeptidase
MDSQRDVSLDSKIADWVRRLGADIGERNDRNPERYARLGLARDMLLGQLRTEHHAPRRLSYRAGTLTFDNIELELPGRNPQAPAIVVGAHYDTARRAPGANDNGTGVACLLALAQLLEPRELECPVRLVAFANEEPPHTRKPTMGSVVYASKLAQERVLLRGMISLESLSPLRSRWIARAPLFVVANLHSRALARSVRDGLGEVEGCAKLTITAPGFLPGIKSSDHWSFWQRGWPAIMLTAGGPFTYPHYHRPSDQLDKLRLDHLGGVARACARAIATFNCHGLTPRSRAR